MGGANVSVPFFTIVLRRGKGVSMAQTFEIDDVIDPADSRRWITMALDSAPGPSRSAKKRPPSIPGDLGSFGIIPANGSNGELS